MLSMSRKGELLLTANSQAGSQEGVNLLSNTLEAPGQEKHTVVVNFAVQVKAKVLALTPAVREKSRHGGEMELPERIWET